MSRLQIKEVKNSFLLPVSDKCLQVPGSGFPGTFAEALCLPVRHYPGGTSGRVLMISVKRILQRLLPESRPLDLEEDRGCHSEVYLSCSEKSKTGSARVSVSPWEFAACEGCSWDS